MQETPDWSTLPVPEDDGAAGHLAGLEMPELALPRTGGGTVDLSEREGLTIVYAYPRAARSGVAMPGDWDLIPGARGCTPEACAFRDHFAELQKLGVDALFGLSVQATAEHEDFAARLHLPFAILSDAGFALTDALKLPTFEADGERLLKRLTLVIRDGQIVHVFYPIFPPDAHAQEVVAWLSQARA